jgi:hypothetical protein
VGGPLPVDGFTVRSYGVEHYQGNNMPVGDARRAKPPNDDGSVRLAAFDETSEGLALSREWNMISSDNGIKRNQVDANTSFADEFLGEVNCLFSFIVFGFEKCSTSTMNMGLSHHPNP